MNITVRRRNDDVEVLFKDIVFIKGVKTHRGFYYPILTNDELGRYLFCHYDNMMLYNLGITYPQIFDQHIAQGTMGNWRNHYRGKRDFEENIIEDLKSDSLLRLLFELE